jgi:Cdc6-like AAA superfamily ATPase
MVFDRETRLVDDPHGDVRRALDTLRSGGRLAPQ